MLDLSQEMFLRTTMWSSFFFFIFLFFFFLLCVLQSCSPAALQLSRRSPWISKRKPPWKKTPACRTSTTPRCEGKKRVAYSCKNILSGSLLLVGEWGSGQEELDLILYFPGNDIPFQHSERDIWIHFMQITLESPWANPGLCWEVAVCQLVWVFRDGWAFWGRYTLYWALLSSFCYRCKCVYCSWHHKSSYGKWCNHTRSMIHDWLCQMLQRM